MTAVSVGQGTGPLYSFALCFDGVDAAVDANDPDAIVISGRVLDGNGEPARRPTAMIEFLGHDCFARTQTDDDGVYRAVIAKPAPAEGTAPHLEVLLYLFPVSDHLVTRMYFPADDAVLASDEVLAVVPADRRRTLIATATGRELQFDIRVQGGDETVFFD